MSMIWLASSLVLSNPPAEDFLQITALALIAVSFYRRCCVSDGKGGHLLCAFPPEASSGGFNAPISSQ